jgi:hypothetical protein
MNGMGGCRLGPEVKVVKAAAVEWHTRRPPSHPKTGEHRRLQVLPRSRKPEARSRKSELRSRKSEGNQKSKPGTRKSEARKQKSKARRRSIRMRAAPNCPIARLPDSHGGPSCVQTGPAARESRATTTPQGPPVLETRATHPGVTPKSETGNLITLAGKGAAGEEKTGKETSTVSVC